MLHGLTCACGACLVWCFISFKRKRKPRQKAVGLLDPGFLIQTAASTSSAYTVIKYKVNRCILIQTKIGRAVEIAIHIMVHT